MFNSKSKLEASIEKGKNSSTSFISEGTKINGDIESSIDIRLDGTVHGHIHSAAKLVVGSQGLINGDVKASQVDVLGKISGNIFAKEMVHLRAESVVNGDIQTKNIQIDPSATFNGKCKMDGNVIEMAKANDEILLPSAKAIAAK